MRPNTITGSGIPHALAIERTAQIAQLHYCLHLRIPASARKLQGVQQIRFELEEVAPRSALLLDWRPQLSSAAIVRVLRTLRINGEPCTPHVFKAGHIRIPPQLLRCGGNCIELSWIAPIQDAGSAVTRFRDNHDGACYAYSLFVPAEASTVFPCFDQPDLKARFSLSLRVPGDWTAIAGAPLLRSRLLGRERTLHFRESEPISTYAFAFAAGPFVPLRSTDPSETTRLWVRRSQRRRAAHHAQELLRLNRAAVSYCARYFGHRFPFAKYDLVLIAQFPFRGMEHAGATFLNEDSVLLPTAHGMHERFQRAQLIFHETAHQWLGDLVTMRWFDDLWIKEGFANFMAYKIAERFVSATYSRFAAHDLKQTALSSDGTAGASALCNPVSDLTMAKAAYNNMVYCKAPLVLKQLETLLGKATFRAGARALVRSHAYQAIDWRDLVSAMQRVSERSLMRWARSWILRPGAPQLRLPLRHILADTTESRYARIKLISGEIEPAVEALSHTRAALPRARLWEALWQAVQDAELHPLAFARVAIGALARERQEITITRVLGGLRFILDRVLPAAERAPLADSLETVLWEGARSQSDAGVRKAWFTGLIALTSTDQGYIRLLSALDNPRRHELDLGLDDVFAIAATLVASGRVAPSAMSVKLAAGGHSWERSMVQHCLAAATPEREAKQTVFRRWLHDASLPEHWIDRALAYFNHPAHAHLTLPLLEPALAASPALMRRRHVFFVNRWISSFVAGQHSRQALSMVQRFLSRGTLDQHLRLKVLEASSNLECALAIRRRWRIVTEL